MGSEITSGATSDKLSVNPLVNSANVTLYSSDGRQVSLQGLITFSSSNTFFPGPTPNDIVTITGSATKTVRVLSFLISTTCSVAGVAASVQLLLTKRSALDTGGAFVPTVGVPEDANYTAPTANVGHWTASPGTPGASLGTMNTLRVEAPLTVPNTWSTTAASGAAVEMLPSSPEDPSVGPRKQITLRGANEQLAINFNGATILAQQNHCYTVTWTEE